ncbi:MAG: hypothetical protein IJB79_09100 [Candidatus Gastranaerophilales bacterium]|nr:hypothetical protein [Candidatus Gastranaerophilales bacterium]
MRKIKIEKIQNKMLIVGVKISIIYSLLLILQEYLENYGNSEVIDAQNLLIVALKEFKELKKRFDKVEQILNI